MIRGYKKYIVVGRPLTGGKVLYKQEDDENCVYKMSTNPNHDRWNCWGDYSRFRQHYINEALNPDSQEYESDMIIESFDRLGDATKFMETLMLDRSTYVK